MNSLLILNVDVFSIVLLTGDDSVVEALVSQSRLCLLKDINGAFRVEIAR